MKSRYKRFARSYRFVNQRNLNNKVNAKFTKSVFENETAKAPN